MGSTADPGDIRVLLLTVSDRSARGEREDRSGPAGAEALRNAGYESVSVEVIPDGREAVAEALTEAIESEVDLILTLGGTGIGPRDETPEGTAGLIEVSLPGVSEGLRAAGAARVTTAVLSRGVAGISRASRDGSRTVVVNLPGSTGGVRDGVEYLVPILPHLIDQLRGGDH